MRNLYFSMGFTFLLINILYTIIIPFTIVTAMPPKDQPDQQGTWYATLNFVEDIRTELTLIWLVQMLIFLHKVSLRDTSMISNTTKLHLYHTQNKDYSSSLIETDNGENLMGRGDPNRTTNSADADLKHAGKTGREETVGASSFENSFKLKM